MSPYAPKGLRDLSEWPRHALLLPGAGAVCEPCGEQADEHYLAIGASAAGEIDAADGAVDGRVEVVMDSN